MSSTEGTDRSPARRSRASPGQWWLDRSVRVKGLIVVVIPIMALVAVTVAALSLQLREQDERLASIAANNLTRSALAVLADAIDAETGIRGYAASGGDPQFLQAYDDGQRKLAVDLKAMNAAATSATEAARADSVSATVADQLNQLANLKTQIDGGNAGPQLTPLLAAGKASMERLRGQIDELTREPTTLVLQKRNQINNLETSIEVVEVSGLVLGLLACLAGIALFAAGISKRVQQAANNADRLGTNQPLLPTAPAADELGRLNASLTEADRLLNQRLAELGTARDEAVQASALKNSFLSRTSHELRTPLNAILGFAQLLEMGDLNADDLDSAAHIHRAGRHLLSLINELIDISRVESGDLHVSVEPVSIADVSTDIVSLLRPLAASRQITIEQSDLNRNVAVRADHQRLKQVLVNLVSNAVKYNRQGGRITIGYDIDVSHCTIHISDTGPGLTAADIVRIWTPFERLDADRHGVEGTGIGLPLAKALTGAMKGEITVASEPGAGSTFSVRLPRADDLASATTSQDLRRLRHTANVERRISVLSIEDNVANSELLAQVFRSWPGISLLSADNALDGLELALAHLPDIILLDLHLPDMSGEEAFTRLRAEPATAGIPVVVLSADANPATIRRLLGRGAAAYLTKPLDLRELQRVLKITTQGVNGRSIDGDLVRITTVAELSDPL